MIVRGVKFASALLVSCSLLSGSVDIPATAAVMVRGHHQTLRLYGARTGSPVIVASGDGGWIHLAPFVAEQLAPSLCSSPSSKVWWHDSTSRPRRR